MTGTKGKNGRVGNFARRGLWPMPSKYRRKNDKLQAFGKFGQEHYANSWGPSPKYSSLTGSFPPE
jgi:hypothetical protein